MHGAIERSCVLLQERQVLTVVNLKHETGSAIVSPVDHMLRETREIQSWLPWHGPELAAVDRPLAVGKRLKLN
jgi:hypothetical protein